MSSSARTPKLARFYGFFTTYGRERLDGLDRSYFEGMAEEELEEAWRHLANRRFLDEESAYGLWLIDWERAVELFKRALAEPMETSLYPAERDAIERARLQLLAYVSSVEPDRDYVDAICGFANSEFEDVRAQFARTVSPRRLTPDIVDALKAMILTESARLALICAVNSFMGLYGMSGLDMDSCTKEIYLSLMSTDQDRKLAAIEQVEASGRLDYLQ